MCKDSRTRVEDGHRSTCRNRSMAAVSVPTPRTYPDPLAFERRRKREGMKGGAYTMKTCISLPPPSENLI